MSVKIINFSAPSNDGIHDLNGKVFLPQDNIKGFFHIVHGMTEHIERYEKFMTDMANEGWITFGYDHLGHGKTALNDSELGFIASKNGWDLLAKDVKAFSDAVMTEFTPSSSKLPSCLLGHSMGSFVVRYAFEKYVSPDRLIIMGTGGQNPAANAGLALIEIIKLFAGEKHISKFINNMAFGSYNSRFCGGTDDDPSPWLTNDTEIRKKYYADKFCTFKFTVSAMGDLIRIMKYSNRPDWYRNIKKDIPVTDFFVV